MKKNNLKNIILVVIFVVLAPLILVGITSLSNALGGKSKHATIILMVIIKTTIIITLQQVAHQQLAKIML